MSKRCHKYTLRKIHVNNTLFVDDKYGNDLKGKADNPAYPYKTINFAMSTLSNSLRTPKSQYIIKVAPGVYNEIVSSLSFVNIIGSDKNATFILGYISCGSSLLENVTLMGTQLPLIDINLNNTLEQENQVEIFNINLVAMNIYRTNGNPVVNIGGNGLNSLVLFDLCNFDLTVSHSNPITDVQNIFNLNNTTNIINSDIYALLDFKAPGNLFVVNALTTINNVNMELRVSDAPQSEINLFNAVSRLNINNSNATIIVEVLNESYKNDINYIKTDNANIVLVSNSLLEADGVSVDFFNLVDVINEFCQVELINLSISNIDMPRLKGFTNSVNFTIQTGTGNNNISGGFYSGIKTVEPSTSQPGYFVKENDSTILSNSLDVNIFDPTLANLQVTSIGKIITIKNIGNINIQITGQNNSIFDGSITLNPLESVQLQSDNKKWYIINFYKL